METNFKVGDPVWDDVLYPGVTGKVIIISSAPAPVIVQFGRKEESYYADGKYYEYHKPTLSKVPYTFELPEQPVEFEEGDPVLVRDCNTHVWIASRFAKDIDSDEKFVTLIGSIHVGWKQCIPFDINKLGRV